MSEPVKQSRFLDLVRNGDYFLATGLFCVVLLLILPVPKALLDLLLSISIGFAVLTLLVIIYVREPVQFSVFPSLLLVATLYRLALNIASTRLILLDADAGKIIQSFGSFVVGGNFVVGAVVFLILVLVNFIVITKGAGRIAEVAARFTLDAMPGKQMAIDAELNAGMIDERQATERRRKIQQEADFYGKMDGASKFVRGDAIAGILITLINVIGGFGIGIMQRGLSLRESMEVYTLLSIGDGLVSQIPALILSVAAGLLITRSSGSQNLGSSFGKQLGFYPRAFGIMAGILFVFAIMPGMPRIPFMTLAILTGVAAWVLKRSNLDATRFANLLEDAERQEPGSAATGSADKKGGDQQDGGTEKREEEVSGLVEVDTLAVELGYSLLRLADKEKGGDILERITGLRKSFAREMGVVLPSIAVRDNFELDPQEYRFLLRGKAVARGRLYPDRSLAMNVAGGEIEVPGERAKEPVFGLDAVWVDESGKKKAELAGFTVVDAVSVLCTHLNETFRAQAHEILTRQDVQSLIDRVKEKNPALISELFPDVASVGMVQGVLKNLLREGISIRNLSLVLECVGDVAPHSKNPNDLSEHARRRLAPYFVPQYEYQPGKLKAVTLDPRLEQHLVSRVQRSQFEVGLSLDPQTARHILENLTRLIAEMNQNGFTPLVLTMAEDRQAFKRFFESSLPRLVVVSYQEIPPDVDIENFAIIPAPARVEAPSPADTPEPAAAAAG